MNKGQQEAGGHLANACLFGATLIAARSVADSDMRTFTNLFVVLLAAYVLFAVVFFIRAGSGGTATQKGAGPTPSGEGVATAPGATLTSTLTEQQTTAG